jgi:hypothetical protein
MDNPTEINPVTEEKEALDRIARTSDGRLLHRYLRRVLEAVVIADNGALLAHNGRRSLARDLMAEMAEGIKDAGRDEPILTRPNRPVATDRRPKRRVEPDPAVEQFLTEHGPGAS